MTRVDKKQVTVLLAPSDDERFSAYCEQKGFKKSTLIARLIREHLNREGFGTQPSLPLEDASRGLPKRRLTAGGGQK